MFAAARRLPALILALALCCAVAAPARADGPATQSSGSQSSGSQSSGSQSSGRTTPALSTLAAPVDPSVEAGAALEQAEAFAAGVPSGLRLLPGLSTVLAARLARTGVEGSQVQRDLFRTADDLGTADRLRARALLARPTDGRRDLYGTGYRVAARRTCAAHVCVHWVASTGDAPPSRAWVRRTLKVMEKVWRTEVDRLGYRAPLPDGRRGGDARFDVYLQDLGSQGAYGYCTPEQAGAATSRDRRTSAGYCVLDNDFAARQFVGAKASLSLKVTAAHEFFHAVQLAYSTDPDPWFAESTAVWMENQVYGGIDDNRQYLPFGQLAGPGRPLDRFQSTGFAQYGNFVFWQRLSERFGKQIVRRVWERAGRGAYSSQALREVLAGRLGGLPAVLADYGSALSDPSQAFREGASWPTGKAPTTLTLDPATATAVVRTRLDHLATTSYVVRPDAVAQAAGRSALHLVVRGPRTPAAGPAAQVRVLKTDGTVASRKVRLDQRGRGATVVSFSAAGVSSVTLTLANASTRFDCRRGTVLSCQGVPLDDNSRFRAVLSATSR